ncbi:MAG: ABC transporter permease [Dehalococcoidia bacterium]|nr:ABC transporter permease [Dehalococcoidia bacterium]
MSVSANVLRDEEYFVDRRHSRGRQLRAVARFYRHEPLGALGLSIFVMLVLVALCAPLLAPYGYSETNIVSQLQDPSREHLFGTDNLGRDVFSRIVYGARVEVLVSLGAVLIAGAIAVVLGTLSGYAGGWVDLIVQRFVDVQMAFPGLILLITILSMFEPGMWQVTIAVGILLAPAAIRVVRSAALSAAQMPYVEAAHSSGATHTRVVLRHILPNVFAPTMVTLTTMFGLAILLEATLSFLGYGVPPPEPSWGSMLGPDARRDMLRAPLLSIWPGLAIFLAVYSFNVLGDSLRDVLDPRLRV